MNEEDIFPTFDAFGPLKDVAIIRDKITALHRGCAFVTFWSAADAQRAQEALHDNFTFPGARRSAQVKPAEPSGKNPTPTAQSPTVKIVSPDSSNYAVPENKLFVGMLSRKAGETDVQELFAPYGEIREIYMIRNADGSSKCAAFLRFVKRECAIQAIDNLNGNIMMEGAARPLIVKFADNKHQRQQRQMRSVRRHEIMAVMGPPVPYPGYPPQLPHPGAAPHYPMHGHPGAASQYPPGAAPQYPSGPTPQYPPGTTPQYPSGTTPQYPQGTTPQYPMQPHQYTAAGYGPGGQHTPPQHAYMYPPQYAQAATYPYPPRQDMRPPNPRPREGPAGANLFVYHLPHDLTDADLATAFNPFGNVLSAKVYVDKYTGESKGFGKLCCNQFTLLVGKEASLAYLFRRFRFV
jgi:CUG-BP- and ETR3-like factor